MRFANGYLVLGRWGGAPVRAHWTLPLGAFFFGHLQFVPGFWLGFFLIILIHEMGHAFVVRRQRCRVISIDVHGIGGLCQWSGGATPIGRARIAWGGVQAQFLALLFTLVVTSLLGAPSTAFAAQLVDAFTNTNVFIILLNLMPVPPLDGAEAWKLPGLLRQRHRRQAQQRRRTALERELADVDAGDRDIRPEAKAAVDAVFRKINEEKERER